jgi:hypothetical protein
VYVSYCSDRTSDGTFSVPAVSQGIRRQRNGRTWPELREPPLIPREVAA